MNRIKNNYGFTLLELFIAMVVGMLVLGVVYSIHNMQQASFKRETMKLNSQRNLRSAMNLMETEVRMAGYDRMQTDNFEITDIRMDADNNGTITFTFDNGVGGNSDNGVVDSDETITYAIMPGSLNLGRDSGGGPVLLADGIEAIGFAFAFDDDQDGVIDFNDDDADGVLDAPPGGNEGIYWAVDKDKNNRLDTNIDTNKDGRIDLNDGEALLPSEVDADRIRAVKIFLLARTKGPDRDYIDNNTYVVGFRRIINPGDNFRRQLMTMTVRCRNLGL